MAQDKPLSGPDFKSGIEFDKLGENEPMLGHYDGEPVLLVRQGDQLFATGAACTHYGGPLAEGLVVGNTIRCPWHHARFSLHSGEAEGAPALNPISCFAVRRQGDKVAITGKKDADFRVTCPQSPSSVVIIGAGAAGSACADMLRTKGYQGPITLVAEEQPSPVDRPNLSKDYLAGSAPEDWIPLRTPDYYQSNRVELVAGVPAIRIRPAAHQVSLRDGRTLNYGALLLATGAEPRSLPIEGADRPHVYRLRTLADSKAIIAKAQQAKKCVVIGSSFIGLEVAASLRSRECEITVISQDSVPLEKILGPELGRFVQKLHERHGVHFLLGTKPTAIRDGRVEMGEGRSVDAEMVILGVGVSPRTSLASEAGAKVDNGDYRGRNAAYQRSRCFCGGRCRPVSGINIRRIGADRTLGCGTTTGAGGGPLDAGHRRPIPANPVFLEPTLRYYDRVRWICLPMGQMRDRGGSEKSDAYAVYLRENMIMAVATIGRDRLSLQVEAAMEEGRTADLQSILEAAR